ncbi:MAG: molybdenum cofactor guanylyltransferase MobA [Deltaproteobacteria bacterium]
MSPLSKPTGLLLAGGQSRRMKGAFRDGQQDKSLLEIGGKPMLAHVIERLAPQVGDMLISANGDPARFSSFGLPVVPDTIGDFAGPLAGLLAGMRWSQREAPEKTHIVSVSSDAPFLPADLVVQLQSAVRDRDRAVAIARSGAQLHSVIGLWPVALADELEAALLSGTRKVSAWTERYETVAVGFAPIKLNGREVDPFFNANTPEELATARQLLAGVGDKPESNP